jgi:hypothetical protein
MAQQSLAEIIDAIATINAEIPGMNASYGSNTLPAQLPPVFPASFVLLGWDDWTKFGPTEFWIYVVVAPVASTGNIGNVYQQCLQLSQAFHDAYSLRTGLIGDRMIDRSKLTTKLGIGSTGFQHTLKWGTASFYGFTVNLPLMPTQLGS